MIKQAAEEKIVKGEVESYSKDITPFPGNRGSRGMRLENEWHNFIGDRNFLESMSKIYPAGSYIKFKEKKNKKGYWDAVEGSIKEITRSEAYSREEQVEIETKKENNVENIEENLTNQQKEFTEERNRFTKEAREEKFRQQQKPITPDMIVENKIKELNKLPKAQLIIFLEPNRTSQIKIEIEPASSEKCCAALTTLLAYTEIAKDTIKDKLKLFGKPYSIEIESQSQDGQHD